MDDNPWILWPSWDACPTRISFGGGHYAEFPHGASIVPERQLRHARLCVSARELAEVVQAFIDETVEYSTVNNLGDAGKLHNVRWGRAVLHKAKGEIA